MSPLLLGLLSSLLALQNAQNSPPKQSPAISKLPAVQDGTHTPLDRSRRQAIVASVASVSFGIGIGVWFPLPGPASASEVRAPIECLLPATRVKLYIDEMVSLCTALLVSTSTDNDSSTATLDKLEKLLFHPPVFIKTTAEASIARTGNRLYYTIRQVQHGHSGMGRPASICNSPQTSAATGQRNSNARGIKRLHQ
jgi:hypothetical protein